MNIERTFDKALVHSFMTKPEIFSTAFEDAVSDPNFDIQNDGWLKIEKNGEVIALCVAHHKNSVSVELHMYVLMKHRKKHSLECGQLFRDWLLFHTVYHKFQVTIPEIYPNIERFLYQFNFKKEGELSEAYLKHGELMSHFIYGVTRPELESQKDG